STGGSAREKRQRARELGATMPNARLFDPVRAQGRSLGVRARGSGAGFGWVAADLDLGAVQLAAAGGAVQDGVELAAAGGVGEQDGGPLGGAEPPVAPLEHHHDVREEGPALVREPVLAPAGARPG